MCGGKGDLFHVEMEGSKIVACDSCSVYGKKIKKVQVQELEKNKPDRVFVKKEVVEPLILIVDDYNFLIKKKRESLGLKQEELAKAINEKESLIQQIESKKIEPSLAVAEKLEKKLGLKLIEEYKSQSPIPKTGSDKKTLTLGDMIEIKTRKKK